MTKHFYEQAIVIGGSIAGLLAARVLTEHFNRVTIIERDTLPDTPDFRKGVPQAHYPHILLKRGELIMGLFAYPLEKAGFKVFLAICCGI